MSVVRFACLWMAVMAVYAREKMAFGDATTAIQLANLLVDNSSSSGADWPLAAPHSRAKILGDTQYIAVHSLDELREQQKTLGLVDFEVDIEAQLTFAAQYWTVFYIQSGQSPAMVHCSDAVTAILCHEPVGRRLKLRALAYRGQPSLHLVSLELLAEAPKLEAMPLTSLANGLSVPLDSYVQTECELLEVIERGKQCSMVAMLAGTLVEIHAECHLSDLQRSFVGHHRPVIVTGTVSPHKLDKPESNYSIRIMRADQITQADSTVSVAQQPDRPRTVDLKGQVVFSDMRGQVLIKMGSCVKRIDSMFAKFLPAGKLVTVSGIEASESQPNFTANYTQVLSESELPKPLTLPASATLDTSNLPVRVSVEAVVLDRKAGHGLSSFRLQSGAQRFTALVIEGEPHVEATIRSGDRVRVIGVPMLESDPTAPARKELHIYVNKPADLVFLSSPLTLTLTHLTWAASLGLVFVGLVFSWNWMLRKQVNLRTRDLNQISSHLRMSFDAINEAVLITDASRTVIGCNRQFAMLFGRTPQLNQPVTTALEVIRTRLSDPDLLEPVRFINPSDSRAPVTETLQLNRPMQVVHLFVAPIFDEAGTYQGHLWTFDDITEKQRLESELIQSQKMEAIGRLSGGIAHDFNNLLTILRSNLSLLKHSYQREMQSECFDAAETAISRAAELTQQLLDFSRRSQFEYQVIDLNELITHVGQFLGRSFDPSIDLVIEPADKPMNVRVDINRLEQVLINMCINARDALQGKGGKIVLRALPGTSAADGSSWAAIEVEDNGCGIASDIQQHIFEPFFTTKKPGEGTGLGLSMAHGVIEQLGGKIQCQSTLDKGTCFRIDLPVTTQSILTKTDAAPTATCTVKRMRILLIDDEELIRHAGKALLSVLGHHVDLAANGPEGLAMLDRQAYDAVLLDLTMPDMSGREVFIQLRQRFPRLPVAICTGYLIDRQAWLNDPAYAPPSVLQKPYSINDLTNFLENSLKLVGAA